MPAQALIATPETDAKLAAEYRLKGADAKRSNRPRTDAPGGMIGVWWLQGYDSPYSAGGIAQPL